MTNQITRPAFGYKGFTNVYLVHGISKRAIRIVMSGFPGRIKLIDDEEIARDAAYYAAAKGWKTAYVEPDILEGFCAWVLNPDQSRTAYNKGYPPNSYHSLGMVVQPPLNYGY